MEQNNSPAPQSLPPCEMSPETCSPGAFADASSGLLLPLPSREGFEETPSATTTTLPTPEPVHPQLDNVERYKPQFIFYPISWDGTESVPSSEINHDPSAKSNSNEERLPNIEARGLRECGEPIDCARSSHCSEDPFRRIDHWRNHIIKCTCGTSEPLEPLEMEGYSPSSPIISTKRESDSERWYPVLFSATSSGEDDVQVWVDQWSVDGIFCTPSTQASCDT